MDSALLKRITDLKSRCTTLRNTDIGYSNLGPTIGFKELEETKNRVIDIIIDIMNSLETEERNLPAQTEERNLPAEIIDHRLKTLERAITEIEAVSNSIEPLVKQIHEQNYPHNRRARITEMQSLKDNTFPEVYSIWSQIKTEQIYRQFIADEKLNGARSQIQNTLNSIQGSYDAANKIVGTLRDLSTQKGIQESSKTFQRLRNNHAEYENNWFTAFLASALLTLALTLVAISMKYESSDSTKVLVEVLKHFILIGIPAVGMRLSLKKYNLERNLRILYDHRSTVLEQYQLFENGISSDEKEAKNSLRLEIARHVFSDPATGYVTDKSPSELSINPILNFADKAVSRLP